MRASQTSQTQAIEKPLWRGILHQYAFFIAIGACCVLLARSTTPNALLASGVYSLGLLLLFGMSAAYHRIHWQPKARLRMKRLDHAAIFVFIAGTVTPIALLGLNAPASRELLLLIWAAAFLGVLQSIFWVAAPKWMTAALCVIAGWLAFPYMPMMKQTLSELHLQLLVAGGIVYTAGAVFYAAKKPALWSRVFGYHELFHLMTIVGAGLHFAVVYALVT